MPFRHANRAHDLDTRIEHEVRERLEEAIDFVCLEALVNARRASGGPAPAADNADDRAEYQAHVGAFLRLLTAQLRRSDAAPAATTGDDAQRLAHQVALARTLRDGANVVVSFVAQMCQAAGAPHLAAQVSAGLGEIESAGHSFDLWALSREIRTSPALTAAFDGGVAAPSANRFGRVSATTAAHVREEFGAAVEVVLDGGACDVGIESTIVDVSAESPVLLRPGGVGLGALEAVLGAPLARATRDAPRAPGTLKSHYAPVTPLMLVESDVAPELMASLVRQEKKVAVLSFSSMRPLLPGLTWLYAPADPHGYAHALYANLRELDASRSDLIVVESPPQRPEWAAVLDRLTRAAAGSAAIEAP